MTNEMLMMRVNPMECEEHPALAGFPMMAPDAAEVLRQSIAEQGLLDPLKIAKETLPGQTAKWLVVDGRNRLAALKTLQIEDVPAIVVETDPVEYALATAIARRQLTKSGVVLLLFERHPELVEQKGKKGNPKLKPSIGVELAKCDSFTFGQPHANRELATFQKLADKFAVPREYFSILARITESCTPEQWVLVRESVLYGEVSIPRIHAGLGGLKAGVDGNGKRKPVQYEMVFDRSVTSFENTWSAWGKLKAGAKIKMVTRFTACLASDETPEEIRHAVIDAMKHWPGHLRARAAAELKRGLKS